MGRVDDGGRVEEAGQADDGLRGGGRGPAEVEDDRAEADLTPIDLAELDVLDPDREERPETD